ncbi:TPA: hypothetical protein ACKQCJ_000780 [Stenotrophomonas maltophilia]
MELEWADLVEGSDKNAEDGASDALDGISGALRCSIMTKDGEQLVAILKRDPPEHVFAEALCALLLNRWGLSVPRPFLVQEAGGVAFASADMRYPNLKQKVGIDGEDQDPVEKEVATRLAVELVSGFPTTNLALAIDEAIDNRDRNLGNVLWDGIEETWIDHAMSLGNALHMADCNKLCMIMTAAGKANEAKQAAITHWTALNRSAIAPLADKIDEHYDTALWRDMILQRLDDLGSRIMARFPQPDDLLANLP